MLPTTFESSATRPSTRLDNTLHLVLVGSDVTSSSEDCFPAAAAIAGEACFELDPSNLPTYAI